MREPQTKEIDGIAFTVRPLSGMKGTTFLPRLNKVLGPALGALAASRGVLDASALKDALVALGDRLDEKEMEHIVRTLLGDCNFQPTDGSAGGALMSTFDIVMQGRPETVYKLLAFALEVNYSGFFPVLASLGARFGAGGPSTSPTPSPKPGLAGA